MHEKKLGVLLIGDDPLFLSLSVKKLQEAAFLEKIRSVTHVKEAREYLDFCTEGKICFPDLIFLDIHMHGIAGMDFADLYNRRYAEKHPDTKLIMLTASRSWEDVDSALNIPAVDKVLKNR